MNAGARAAKVRCLAARGESQAIFGSDFVSPPCRRVYLQGKGRACMPRHGLCVFHRPKEPQRDKIGRRKAAFGLERSGPSKETLKTG